MLDGPAKGRDFPFPSRGLSPFTSTPLRNIIGGPFDMAKILSVVLLLQVLVLDSVLSFPSFDLRARSFTVLESRIASAPAIKRDSLPGGAQTFTGSRLTPDAAHPYIAPGPNDFRGPCPG